MASLGSLVVSLAMDTAKFTGAIGKSQQQMLRLAQEAGKMGAAIGTAIAAAGGATALLVRQAINAADANIKQAQAIGLTVEAYTQLGYAAGLSGVGQDQLAQAMSKLAKNAVDTAAGTGEAKDAFAAMGIEVKNADGTLKSQQQLLGEVADKFASYRDGAEKTALAQRVFGKSGTDLIPLLNGGAKGLADMAAEADLLGVTMDTNTGRAAEAFNDNLTRLSAVKEGLVNRITRELLPSLQSMSEWLVESAKSSGVLDTAARAAATGVRLLLTAGAHVGYVFAQVGNEIGGIAAQLAALGRGDMKAFSAIGDMMKADAKAARASLDAFTSTLWDDAARSIEAKAPELATKMAAPLLRTGQEAAKAGKAIRTEVDRVYEAIERRLAGMSLAVDTQGASDKIRGLIELSREGASGDQLQRYIALADAQQRFREQTEAAAEAQRRQQEIAGEAARLYEETRTPIERLNMEQARLNDLLQAGAINWDTYARATFAAQENYEQATKKTAETADDFTNRAAENIQRHLGDGLFQAMSGNFKGIAKGFTDMLNRMVAEALAANLARALMGDSVKGGSGEGWIGGLVKAFGSMLFGGKAGGGPVSPHRPYLVGEHGPEVMVPTTAGSIQPQASQTIVLNVNVTAQPGMTRETALQQGERIGRGAQRALARNG